MILFLDWLIDFLDDCLFRLKKVRSNQLKISITLPSDCSIGSESTNRYYTFKCPIHYSHGCWSYTDSLGYRYLNF